MRDGGETGADGKRRELRDGACQFLRFRQKLSGRDDAVDEAESERFVSRQFFAREHGSESAPVADGAGEALCPAISGNQAEFEFG